MPNLQWTLKMWDRRLGEKTLPLPVYSSIYIEREWVLCKSSNLSSSLEPCFLVLSVINIK